jgi:hypothetical protein
MKAKGNILIDRFNVENWNDSFCAQHNVSCCIIIPIMSDSTGSVDKQNKHRTCDPIINVQDYDVLLGRGKLYEKHLGNQKFQGMLNC